MSEVARHLAREHVYDKLAQGIGGTFVRGGMTLLNPFGAEDKVPFFSGPVDEIVGGSMVLVGYGMISYSYLSSNIPMLVASSPPTSTNGTLSPRGNGKKQISSTSHRRFNYYGYRRKKYEYGKKRRY